MTFDLEKFNSEDAADFIDVALEGLSAIARLVGGPVGNISEEILATIKSIVAAIFGGYEGTVTFEAVRAELAKFQASLETNDKAADAALDSKFPSNPSTSNGNAGSDGNG